MSDAAPMNRPMTRTRLAAASKHLAKMVVWRDRLIAEAERPNHPKHHMLTLIQGEREALLVSLQLVTELRQALHEVAGAPAGKDWRAPHIADLIAERTARMNASDERRAAESEATPQEAM
jgi:hypothetical protein